MTARWEPTRLVAVDGVLYAWSQRNADGRWQVRLETGVVVYAWVKATRVKRTGLRVLRLLKGFALADLRRVASVARAASVAVRQAVRP